MMTAAGHQVVIYSGEENDAVCSEHVPLISEQERRGWFGGNDQGAIHPITWDPSDVHWRVMNGRAAAEISKRRADKRDLLLLSSGACQVAISEFMPEMTACEPFVGYEGIAVKHRAFESNAWRHHVYGLRGQRVGHFYDEVIPNYFDRAEFPADQARTEAGTGDYLLFIGRVIERKGPHIAAKIADAAGMELVVAGPGVREHGPGWLEGDGVRVAADRLRYVGPVGIQERSALMAGARAVIVPTLYLEPFGGVAVEAMLSGTPVITSDFGAFHEIVDEGVTGYRFRTLQEAVDALPRCDLLNPARVRARAVKRFSLKAVAPRFTRWLEQIDGIWDGGWDTLRA